MDVTDIKSANVRKILDVLRFSSGMTKRDIASNTGLSFSTVSNICNDLEEEHVLYEAKSDGNTVGRTPDKYYFCCTKFCTLCVELRQENRLNLAVLDFANNCLFQRQLATTADDNAADWTDLVQHAYEELLHSARFNDKEFVGVGVSVPRGQDYTSGRIIKSSYQNIGCTPFQEIIQWKTGLPCYVENEANLCVVSAAQRHQGSGNILYLHSSTSLGVGAICEGNLLRGKNGYAAEIAHIPIGDPDTICPCCGLRGCIENDLAQRGMNAFRSPQLSASEYNRLTEDRGKKLGELLSILINLFDPQTVYVGGSSFDNYERLMPYAFSVLKTRSLLALNKGVVIEHDENSSWTVQCGINQLVYENWYPL